MDEALKLPIEKRIILYILGFGEITHLDLVSHLLTQDHIALALNVPRGSISRSLKNLAGDGLVQEELSHVKGVRRRKRAYSLSWEGFEKGKELLLAIHEVDADYRDLDGEVATTKLKDLVERVRSDDPELTLMEVVDIVASEGVLDLRNIHARKEAIPVPPVKKESDRKPGVPAVRRFYGREEELKLLREISEKSKFIVIQGAAGMGKTTLIAKHLETETKPVLWHRLRPQESFETLLNVLNGWLGTDIMKVVSTASEVLLKELVGRVLVLDDLHRCDGTTMNLLTALKDSMDDQDITIICSARNRIPFYDSRDSGLNGTVAEIELAGLDEPAARELLEERGLDLVGEDLERIFSITRGHPLALELVTEDLGAQTEMMRFFQEEVFSKLTPEERHVLETLSVHREPMGPEALGGFETLERLQDRSLIDESTGLYEIKGFLREYVYHRIPLSGRKRYHKAAAELYPGNIFERAYHLLSAGEEEAAAGELIADKDHLIYNRADPLMRIICENSWDALSPEMFAQLEKIRWEIDQICGEWDNVQEYYYQSYLLGGEQSFGEALKKAGYMNWSLEELEKGLLDQKNSLEHLPTEDHSQRAEIFRVLGWTHWMMGDFQQARDATKDSLEEVQKGVKGVAPRMNLAMANILWAMGEKEEAEEHYLESLNGLTRPSDDQIRTRVLNNLGCLKMDMEDKTAASEYLREALRRSSSINFLRGKAYILLHLGVCEGDEQHLEDARSLFARLDDRPGCGYVHIHLSRGSARREEHLEQGKSFLEDLELPYLMEIMEKEGLR